MRSLAYVGCRTTDERQGEGTGLSVFQIDDSTGKLELVQHLDGLVNPSYLAWGPGRRHLYVVHGDHAEVSAFASDESTGELTHLGTAPSGGANPVHLTVLDGRTLAVANYASGTIGVLNIEVDGSLGRNLRQILDLSEYTKGRPSNPHQILRDPRSSTVVVPDKGSDTVFLLDYNHGKLRLSAAVPAEPGSGPRHAAFHPTKELLYVVNELASTVTTYKYTAGGDGPVTVPSLRSLQTVSTVPSAMGGAASTSDNTASGIVATPDFSSVYVSNRGHNSVVHYRVDPLNGHLVHADWRSSGGNYPRFLTLDPDGSRLYVANERTSTIVHFAVNPRTGDLRREYLTTRTGSPVCIEFKTTIPS